jgi:hypothetical protein
VPRIAEQTGLDGNAAEAGGAPAGAGLPAPADPVVMENTGVDPVATNASREARNLLNYLYETYGKGMLAGQMESTWMQGGADYELNYVEAMTGKLPAIRGLDFIQSDGVAQRAIDWWGRGGISNIRWHWGAPTHGEGHEASQEAVDIDRVLTPGTPEYGAMLASLNRTAAELTKLRDANVPVLWTPYHELNGNWFWWGKETPQQFIRLWRFMFEYFDGEKQATPPGNPQTPVGRHGQLHVDGPQFVDQSGVPVQLKGVSTMWLNWEDRSSSSREALEWMRDNWGLRVIRAAMGGEPGPGVPAPAVHPGLPRRAAALVSLWTAAE